MARSASGGLDYSWKAENAMSEAFVCVELGTNDYDIDLPDTVASDTIIGVTQETAPTAGQSVRVRVSGITKVVANGAFSKGDTLVAAATTGRVDTIGESTAYTEDIMIGIALEAADAAGEVVEMLIRH